jgi:ParB/RepB/Spo0J family partition protein
MKDTIFTGEDVERHGSDSKEPQAMANSQPVVSDSSKTVKGGKSMEVVNLDLDSLVVEYRLRQDLGDLESLQASIRKDGLQEPLLVYEVEDNRFAIIDGRRRLESVRSFGWKTVPCLVKENVAAGDAAHLSFVKNHERKPLSAIEVALHLMAMRERFGFSTRDLELKGYGSAASISNRLKLLNLAEDVQKLIHRGDLSLAHGLALVKLPTAKEQRRMAKRIVDHDLPAKRAEVQVDRYLMKGKAKEEPKKVQESPAGDIPGIYIKDSRDMRELPDQSVHLIVSSPPYGVGMEYEVGVSFDEHCQMIQDVLKECARVLVLGGIMALNVGDITNFKGRKGKNEHAQIQLMGHFYQRCLRRHQIYLTDQIIWRKSLNWKKRPDVSFSENTAHTSYRILGNFEPIYIFRKKGERELPSEEVILASRLTKEQWIAWAQGVWDIEPVRVQEGHPAMYPEELPGRLIMMFSYEGDTVLDPWLGSGTTVKVARALNREAVGYEKEPQYKEVIMKKLGIASENTAKSAVEAMKKNLEVMKEGEVEPVLADAVDGHQKVQFADGYAEAGQVA